MDEVPIPIGRLRLNCPPADPQCWHVDQDPLELVQPRKGKAQPRHLWDPQGRLGTAAPHPRDTECWGWQKCSGSRLLELGGLAAGHYEQEQSLLI